MIKDELYYAQKDKRDYLTLIKYYMKKDSPSSLLPVIHFGYLKLNKLDRLPSLVELLK